MQTFDRSSLNLSLIRLQSRLEDAKGRLELFSDDLKEVQDELTRRYIYRQIVVARRQISDLEQEIRRFWE